MKIRDLKHVKDVPYNCNLTGEQRFIYHMGLFNCRMMKFQNAETIISEMNKEYPSETLTEAQINFINEYANKEVLVYLCLPNEKRPDIFVYPENNTPFTVECFI